MRCQNALPRVGGTQRVIARECCNRTAASILRSAQDDKAESLVLKYEAGERITYSFSRSVSVAPCCAPRPRRLPRDRGAAPHLHGDHSLSAVPAWTVSRRDHENGTAHSPSLLGHSAPD